MSVMHDQSAALLIVLEQAQLTLVGRRELHTGKWLFAIRSMTADALGVISLATLYRIATLACRHDFIRQGAGRLAILGGTTVLVGQPRKLLLLRCAGTL